MELINHPIGNQTFHCDHIVKGNHQLKNDDIWEIEIGDHAVMESYRVLRFCPVCAAVVREASLLFYEDRLTRAITSQIMVTGIGPGIQGTLNEARLDTRIRRVVKKATGV